MKPWLIALALARGLDVTSTCIGLHDGYMERNPLLPESCSAQVVVHAGLAVGQIVLLRYIAQHGHPTVAKVLALGAISAEVGATAHNVMIMYRMGH